jgi:hypothetical protein
MKDQNEYYEYPGRFIYRIGDPNPDFFDVKVNGHVCGDENTQCPFYRGYYFLPQEQEEYDRFMASPDNVCLDDYHYHEEHVCIFKGNNPHDNNVCNLPCVVKCNSKVCPEIVHKFLRFAV